METSVGSHICRHDVLYSPLILTPVVAGAAAWAYVVRAPPIKTAIAKTIPTRVASAILLNDNLLKVPGESEGDYGVVGAPPAESCIARRSDCATAYFVSYVKSFSTVAPEATSTFMVKVPNAAFSCQAATTYLPAGSPLISNAPSSPVTAKNGWLNTAI